MKHIEMTLSDGTSRVSISDHFSSEATWPAIAYQFFNFLRAQGYAVNLEDVGASVEDYVEGTKESEEW